jgi:hypothetical protein
MPADYDVVRQAPATPVEAPPAVAAVRIEPVVDLFAAPVPPALDPSPPPGYLALSNLRL